MQKCWWVSICLLITHGSKDGRSNKLQHRRESFALKGYNRWTKPNPSSSKGIGLPFPYKIVYATESSGNFCVNIHQLALLGGFSFQSKQFGTTVHWVISGGSQNHSKEDPSSVAWRLSTAWEYVKWWLITAATIWRQGRFLASYMAAIKKLGE